VKGEVMKVSRVSNNPELICHSLGWFKVKYPERIYLALVELRGYRMVSKRSFKKAMEAGIYGMRIVARYQRLYAAKLAVDSTQLTVGGGA